MSARLATPKATPSNFVFQASGGKSWREGRLRGWRGPPLRGQLDRLFADESQRVRDLVGSSPVCLRRGQLQWPELRCQGLVRDITLNCCGAHLTKGCKCPVAGEGGGCRSE